MCAVALTRSTSIVDAAVPLPFLASSRLSLKLNESKTQKPTRRSLNRHLHGYPRQPSPRQLEQPSRTLSHQVQLQRQRQSSRPKSFKELVEMQKKERAMNYESKWSKENNTQVSAASASVESSTSDSQHSLRAPSLPTKIVSSIRKLIRNGRELDAAIASSLKEELPSHRLAGLKEITRRNRLYEDYHEVMRASTKQMFFHGHPFRGSIMLTAIAPMLFIDTARHISPLWSFIALFFYMGGYYHFFMCKLTRSVWFNPEKDMYLIHMPYKSLLHPVAFKAGNVVEINDLFANLSIRGGMKAYCHKDMFAREEDYERMFKRERAVVENEKLSPKKRRP